MNKNLVTVGIFIAAAGVGFWLTTKYGSKIKASIIGTLGGVPNNIVPLAVRPERPDMRSAATAATTATPLGFGWRS